MMTIIQQSRNRALFVINCKILVPDLFRDLMSWGKWTQFKFYWV